MATPRPSPRPSKPTAFTLVELLVVIAIVALLSALMLAGLAGAGRAQKREATKRFIGRLSDAVMEAFEDFEDSAATIEIIPDPNFLPPLTALTVVNSRISQTEAIRYRLREQFPDSWLDVRPENHYSSGFGRSYHRYKQAVRQRNISRSIPPAEPNPNFPDPSPRFEDAECLYMIVTQSGLFPELVSQLRPAQIGDVDDDGAQEFLDAWGNPIAFLRWAPGFVTDTVPPDPELLPYTTPRRDLSFLQIADTVNRHDPFDLSNSDPRAYALFPLIYSAGPDGAGGANGGGPSPYGILHSANGWPNATLQHVCQHVVSGNRLVGAPDPDNPVAHRDNITNHDIMFE
jgi:prepilin-type N-terminal cleavage/methylation domain-containing protein